ncbi:MAG: hypothetical protein DDT40_01075 [candidate division WS2 bacterium]|nr:hypothetical protein [Candidatus Psychracetigena formicireducens]
MKLPDLLNDLNKDERAELFRLLRSEFQAIPQLVDIKAGLNKEQVIACPHCKSTDIYGHGVYMGRKRYKCKSCAKTFNDFTGTAISGIKKTEKFHEYLEMVVESVTIRKASSKIGVNVKTIFDWRHKLLSSLPKNSGQGFSGIVECDDKQLDINDKGNKKLPREPYKRASDRNTKRGVSNDKISVMVASDRKGNATMQVAKIGRIDAKSIEKTIGDLVTKENILCSDAHPSIIKWAKGKKIEHHTFVASKQHVKSKCYHVQHVNSLDNRYERWIKGFYGIATKYLENYLNWFVFLEKVKKSLNCKR